MKIVQNLIAHLVGPNFCRKANEEQQEKPKSLMKLEPEIDMPC